jgi:hypothetical protein
MNTINSKIDFFISAFLVLIVILFFSPACINSNESALKVVSVDLCDNFDQVVHCIEPKSNTGTIFLKPTSTRKERLTWLDFSNYLYFTARETPGFVITFSRPFSDLEAKEIKSYYVAYLSLNGVRERMEGFEMGRDRIASFHYLGALLKEVKRKQGEEKAIPDLEKLGTILLQFEYQLPNGKHGSIQRETKLSWQ